MGGHRRWECPDLLHSLWLGIGRDASGSLICDLAEFAPWVAHLETWDDRLQWLAVDAREWCRRNKLSPSSIDDWSAKADSNKR